jgi:hypothetical protein
VETHSYHISLPTSADASREIFVLAAEPRR